MNEEKKVGYKKLSLADLGQSVLSSQTHIGLYENMLDFLSDADTTTAILIYDENCEILNCEFDRIENPDGTFRSPKIRMGDSEHPTVVRKIREFAMAHPERDYYLIWFGLDSNELVFFLIDNVSDDYATISSMLPQTNKVYGAEQMNFGALLRYIENRIDNVTIELQQELEIASQTGAAQHKFSRYDIQKAEQQFAKTGRLGEELIAQYLDRLCSQQVIDHYKWENRSKEVGLPYDFVINKKYYVDVKSTRYRFEQDAIFSDSEFEFITSVGDEVYSVYRVFDMTTPNSKLRICRQCHHFISKANRMIADFKKGMSMQNADVRSMKIAVQPTQMFKAIDAVVML